MQIIEEGGVRYLNDGRCNWMSDHPDEIVQCQPFFDSAYGDVLVLGLGLGVILTADVLARVRSVDVVEISEEVINLIWADVQKCDDRGIASVVLADATKFKPERLYDFIWADVWATAVAAARGWPGIERHYSAYLKPGGKIMAWLG